MTDRDKKLTIHVKHRTCADCALKMTHPNQEPCITCMGDASYPSFVPVVASVRKRDGENPLDVQVAGSHYKSKAIQPVEYIHANNLGFLEGCIVKRITRWRDKPAADRFEDLRKIKHEVDLLIELESKGT